MRAREGPDHLAILVHGPPGSGKSAAVAAAAQRGDGEDQEGDLLFPHVRVFRADVAAASGGDVEHALRTAFHDAVKSNLSLLVVDGWRRSSGSPRGTRLPRGVADGVRDGEGAPRAAAQAATARKAARGGRHDVLAESARRVGAVVGVSRGVEVPALSPVEVVNVLRACGAFAGSSPGDVGGGLIGHDAVLDPAARAAARWRGVRRGGCRRSNDFARREPGRALGTAAGTPRGVEAGVGSGRRRVEDRAGSRGAAGMMVYHSRGRAAAATKVFYRRECDKDSRRSPSSQAVYKTSSFSPARDSPRISARYRPAPTKKPTNQAYP